MLIKQNYFECGCKIPRLRHIRMSRTISCPWDQGIFYFMHCSPYSILFGFLLTVEVRCVIP